MSANFYRASFETPKFTLEAFGTSEQHARELLAAAWARHAPRAGWDPKYLVKYAEDIHVAPISTGQVLMDGEPFYEEEREARRVADRVTETYRVVDAEGKELYTGTLADCREVFETEGEAIERLVLHGGDDLTDAHWQEVERHGK